MPPAPAATPSADGHEEGVIHRRYRHTVHCPSLAVSVNFSPARLERAVALYPILQQTVQPLQRVRGGLERQLTVQLEGLSAECMYTIVTTEDGALCTQSSDLEFRWDLHAERLAVWMQRAGNGDPSLQDCLAWASPPNPSGQPALTGHLLFRPTACAPEHLAVGRETMHCPVEEVFSLFLDLAHP